MTKIICPKCGERVTPDGIGRKRLDIPLKNISEALHLYKNVYDAADALGCSFGYIYQELKKQGLKPRDVINRKGKV